MLQTQIFEVSEPTIFYSNPDRTEPYFIKIEYT